VVVLRFVAADITNNGRALKDLAPVDLAHFDQVSDARGQGTQRAERIVRAPRAGFSFGVSACSGAHECVLQGTDFASRRSLAARLCGTVWSGRAPVPLRMQWWAARRSPAARLPEPKAAIGLAGPRRTPFSGAEKPPIAFSGELKRVRGGLNRTKNLTGNFGSRRALARRALLCFRMTLSPGASPDASGF
jgi:hypothetical protein